MAVINPHTTRATGTVLTAAIYNADHQNHITNANSLNAELVAATAANIVEDSNIALLQGKPTRQDFSVVGAATWTRPAGCKIIVAEGVGGGGGAGGCDGQGAGTHASAGGGGSGFFGQTAPINVTANATAAIVIGAAGAAGAAGNNAGGTGGNTTLIVGATTYTWPGGDGSPGNLANTSIYYAFPGTWAVQGTNVEGSSNQGADGFSNATTGLKVSGYGASTPYGIGGDKVTVSGSGTAAGLVGSGFGVGGSGGCVGVVATDVAGGAGTIGCLRIWEFY